MHRHGRAIVILLCVFPLVTQAQATQRPIRVSVAIDDKATGGLFTSGFNSALRAIGVVTLVDKAQEPDFHLRGVVMCDLDQCANTSGYHLSLELVRPLSRVDVSLAI